MPQLCAYREFEMLVLVGSSLAVLSLFGLGLVLGRSDVGPSRSSRALFLPYLVAAAAGAALRLQAKLVSPLSLLLRRSLPSRCSPCLPRIHLTLRGNWKEKLVQCCAVDPKSRRAAAATMNECLFPRLKRTALSFQVANASIPFVAPPSTCHGNKFPASRSPRVCSRSRFTNFEWSKRIGSFAISDSISLFSSLSFQATRR